jgi:hypothetical protein
MEPGRTRWATRPPKPEEGVLPVGAPGSWRAKPQGRRRHGARERSRCRTTVGGGDRRFERDRFELAKVFAENGFELIIAAEDEELQAANGELNQLTARVEAARGEAMAGLLPDAMAES